MARTSRRVACIHVLAGANGAGKSSIGGAALLESGTPYYNPDEAARRIAARNAGLVPPPTQAELNAAGRSQGRALLEEAIAKRLDFAFETLAGLLADAPEWARPIVAAALKLHLQQLR
jgi:predicted ABC-type ATPase